MELQEVAKTLYQTMIQAGNVAKEMQVGIQNEGKLIQRDEDESDAHYAMREAKTKVDEIVQELLLHSLHPLLGDIVSLDVEEETPAKAMYPNHDFAYTLILDPIDGTLPYIEQKDNYSICAALMKKQEVLMAMVYFPTRDLCYSYVAADGTFLYEQASSRSYEEKTRLTPTEKKTGCCKRIYKNSRVDRDLVEQIRKLGYEVIDDSQNALGCPDALLACIRREAFACFCASRNLRDILLGVILTKMEGGHVYDFKGAPIVWKSYGRQPECVFSCFDLTTFFKKLEIK